MLPTSIALYALSLFVECSLPSPWANLSSPFKTSYNCHHFFFFFFWLPWFFIALHGLSLVVAKAGYSGFISWASHCGCQAQAFGMQASVVAARELSSCGTRAIPQWLVGMWNLLGLGIKSVSSAWQADSYTLRQQGSPCRHF